MTKNNNSRIVNLKIAQLFGHYRLPPEGTAAYEKCVENEIARCMGGIYIDDVFIPGFLYWHLFHWTIRDDFEDEYGNVIRKATKPELRDNEWIVGQYLEICRVEKLGYFHVGVRQFGKSEILASYLTYHATLFENTQNVIVGGNDNDLQLIRDKVDFGIRELFAGIRIPKLDKATNKNMARLGFMERGGDPQVWSYMIVRNVSDGINTEGPAGTTAKSFAIDEVGKFSFAQAYEAAKPAFKSKFGWRCVPIMFGTGGSFTKGADAERFFWHPEANNLLAVVDPETGEKTAVFMSGEYRLDCKYRTTLGQYLRETGAIPIDKATPELDKLPMSVSDKVRAKELILAERKAKANDPDRTEYLKLIMYYPLTPRECFLTDAYNYYNGDLAQQQKTRLETNNIKGQCVELFLDEQGEVKYKESYKAPISSFPTKPTENLDAPTVIWEHPVNNPPWGLYVAGIDPYRFNQGESSDSLGAIYIFKRLHDIYSETFQDCFVACYVARPETKEEWNKNAKLLLKYYNAVGLCENDEEGFINYMIAEGEGHMLADLPGWLYEVQPNSTITSRARPKGIPRSSKKIIREIRSVFKKYLEEDLVSIKDTEGNVIRTIVGISQVPDPMLCAELSLHNDDGNFDREVAASLAVVQARKMDKERIRIETINDDPRAKSYFSKKDKEQRQLFGSRNIFVKSSKLF